MTVPLQIGAVFEELVATLIDDAITMVDLFTQVALGDPFFISFLLVAMGGLLVAFASLFFGGLSIASLVGAFFRLAE
jgi:hypothetical protein